MRKELEGKFNMIESFNRENFLDTSSLNKLSLSDGDILIIKFNNDIWDLDTVHDFLKNIALVIPKKVSILPIFNGIEIGVIHYEN